MLSHYATHLCRQRLTFVLSGERFIKVLNEYTQVTIFWFPAFGKKDATRSVMSRFDIYISRIMPLLHIIRLSTAPRHETRALWTRFCSKVSWVCPWGRPGCGYATASVCNPICNHAGLHYFEPATIHYGSSKPVVMRGSKGYSPAFFEHFLSIF